MTETILSADEATEMARELLEPYLMLLSAQRRNRAALTTSDAA